MKKSINKARIKRFELLKIEGFIDDLNATIERLNERAEEIQSKINDNSDSLYHWDKNWLQGGEYDDELSAYQQLIKELEKLV